MKKFLFENVRGHRVIATIPPYVPWMIRSHEGQNSVRLSLEVGGSSLVTLIDSKWLIPAYSKEELLSGFSDMVESVSHMIDKGYNIINLTVIAEKCLPKIKRLPMSDADTDDEEPPIGEPTLWNRRSASYVWYVILRELQMNENEKEAIFSGVTAVFDDITDDETEPCLRLKMKAGYIRDIIKHKHLKDIKKIAEAFIDDLQIEIEEYGYF